MRTRGAILAIAASLAATVYTQQGAPVFRAAVDVIQVDVSAVDCNNRPVRGLTAADFTLLENGRPQEIVAFAAVDVPAAPAQPAAWLRDVPPDVRTNDLGDGRLFAIVMDDAAMPPELRFAASAREIGRSVVERLGPQDLAAVIFVTDSRRSVDFTNDRARLLAAIEGFTPGFAYADQVSSTDNQHFYSSIRTLSLVASSLARVPQRRKAVIYVSTGVPVEADSMATIGRIGPRGVPALDTLIPGGTIEESTSRDMVDALSELLEQRPQDVYGATMQDAFIRAQAGNVNIYSIDPAGVTGMQVFLQSRVRNTRLGGPLLTPLEAMTQARLHRDYLQTVAENSGGRAILATNDLKHGLTQIFEENSAYYLLGYQSTRDAADRTVRRVGVRVGRAGVTARTRNAYYSVRPSSPPPPGGLMKSLADTLGGVLPNPDVTLRGTAAAFAIPGGRAALAIAVGVDQQVLGDAGARIQERLDVLATAFSPDGRVRGSVQNTARVALRAGLPDHADYEVLSRLDLEPGRYQIRLAAHSAMTGKTGSTYLDVEVPEFVRDPMQLSGVVLTVEPAPPAAPTDAAEAFLPVVPTSRRTFRSTDAALGFVRVYQAADRPPTPVTLSVSVTDGTDRVVQTSTEALGPERFTTRQADCRFNLPLSTLAPGEYLLTVEAAQGARTVRRHVRFVVK